MSRTHHARRPRRSSRHLIFRDRDYDKRAPLPDPVTEQLEPETWDADLPTLFYLIALDRLHKAEEPAPKNLKLKLDPNTMRLRYAGWR